MAKIVNAIIIKKEKILTVRRSKEPYLWMYNLPGWHVESGETNEEALVRELKEETNQDISHLKFHALIQNNGNECSIFLAEIEREIEYITSEEIPQIKWLTIPEFIENLRKYNPENWELLLPFLNK